MARGLGMGVLLGMCSPLTLGGYQVSKGHTGRGWPTFPSDPGSHENNGQRARLFQL